MSLTGRFPGQGRYYGNTWGNAQRSIPTPKWVAGSLSYYRRGFLIT
jgi:hypothetical protein